MRTSLFKCKSTAFALLLWGISLLCSCDKCGESHSIQTKNFNNIFCLPSLPQAQCSMADNQWREAGTGQGQRGNVEWFQASSRGASTSARLRQELDQTGDDHDWHLVRLLLDWCWNDWELFPGAPSVLTAVLLFLSVIVPLFPLSMALAVRSWRTAPGNSSMKKDWGPAWPSPQAAPSTTVLPTTPLMQETPPCCAMMMSAKSTLELTSTVSTYRHFFFFFMILVERHGFLHFWHFLRHGKMMIAVKSLLSGIKFRELI